MPVDGLVDGSLPKTPNVAHGRGKPDIAAQSLTASQYTTVVGTVATHEAQPMKVGDRWRFHLGLAKTAAGTNTWTVQVGIGGLGTASDTSVAIWTSGTNSAAIDQAILIVEVVCTAVGSGTSGKVACTAFWANQLTNATGLGNIAVAPGTTAGFDSTVVPITLHLDVSPGASAVMTGWGMSEKIT